MDRLRQVLSWIRHERKLRGMTDMAEFDAHVSEIRPEKFCIYKTASRAKRSEFLSVLNFLHIDLKGAKVLDLGPGYGDSLDICHESGARSIAFTELDPLFFTYNRLKNHTAAFRLNHLTSLRKLQPRKFDFIWVKGSIRADFFIWTQKFPINRLRLENWLKDLEALASPRATTLICPHWKNDGRRRNIIDVENSVFARVMLKVGFRVLPDLAGLTHQPEFPISFYKQPSLSQDMCSLTQSSAPRTTIPLAH